MEINFVEKMFSAELIAKQWEDLINKIQLGTKIEYKIPNGFYLNNLKVLRILNRKFRFDFGWRFLPSILSNDTRL